MDRVIGEALLLPSVSAPAWEERPAGVDTTVGSADCIGVSLGNALSALTLLLPP